MFPNLSFTLSKCHRLCTVVPLSSKSFRMLLNHRPAGDQTSSVKFLSFHKNTKILKPIEKKIILIKVNSSQNWTQANNSVEIIKVSIPFYYFNKNIINHIWTSETIFSWQTLKSKSAGGLRTLKIFLDVMFNVHYSVSLSITFSVLYCLTKLSQTKELAIHLIWTFDHI